MKEHFFISVWKMGNSACAKRHFDVLGDLLLVFSKTIQ